MNEIPTAQDVAERYRRLTPRQKRAFSWLLANLDFLDATSDQRPPMERAEWERLLAYSRDRQDPLLEALLLYQQLRGQVEGL